MEINDAVSILRGADEFLILTHRLPDGDTVGSAAALCEALRRLNKTAYVLKNPDLTERFSEYLVPYIAPPDFKPGFVVSVDIADTGLFFDNAKGMSVDLAIDHHPSYSGFAKESIVRPELAACGELVYELIKKLLGAIDKVIARPLYLAVSTDTGCFRYSNTTGNTHRVAAELMDTGIEYFLINRKIFTEKSFARFRVEGMLAEGLELYDNGETAVAVLTLAMMKSAAATENDTDDLANLPRSVEGTNVGILIKEMPDGSVKVSLRTADKLNASEVCAVWGGGGHKRAAGCTFYDCDVNEARDRMLAAIAKVRGK